jgi:hypothetical protein
VDRRIALEPLDCDLLRSFVYDSAPHELPNRAPFHPLEFNDGTIMYIDDSGRELTEFYYDWSTSLIQRGSNDQPDDPAAALAERYLDTILRHFSDRAVAEGVPIE